MAHMLLSACRRCSHGTAAIGRTAACFDEGNLYTHLVSSGGCAQLPWPWDVTARRCGSSSASADGPLIVSAEAAHVAARRHINLVHIPDFLASPPVEQVKALGLRVKNIRQIASNLRDAEKCLALTQQKGGGRHSPVYLPNVAQLKAIGDALRASASPASSPTHQHPLSIESGGATSEQHAQLSVSTASEASALQHQIHEDAPLDMVAQLAAPQNITVRIGGRRDLEGRAHPALPPTDPTAVAVARSLARAGLTDASLPMAMVRKQVKKLPELSDGMFGRFPEQAALYMNPFKEKQEMKNIHPMSPERRPAEAARALAASSKLLEKSDDKTAVAFAATSLPARYATVLRILEELKFRDRKWQPETLLDYASGPGSGMWATMQVWGSVRHMTAIESRPAMVRMGVRIQDTLATEAAASHNADPSGGGPAFTVPSIRWLRNLPAASKRAAWARDAAGRPPPPSAASQQSLVISAHALTRVPTHAERMRVVRDLWNRVEPGGALVLVEPGSPVGSAFVRQAREQVLREETKRQAQIDVAMSELVELLPAPLRRFPTWDVLAAIESSSSAAHTAHSAAQLSDGADSKSRVHSDGARGDRGAPLAGVGNTALQHDHDSSSSSVLQDAWEHVVMNHRDSVPQLQKAAARLRWLQAHAKGAYVVAPCAHDGVCPMDTPGQTAWCHFSQRVERRYLHRQCRYRKGIKNGAKNWEYERYSYVVLRRAPRPPPPRDVYIAPAFRQYEEDALAYVAVPPAIVRAAQAGADAALDPLEVFPFFKDGAAARAARAKAEGSAQEASTDMHEDAGLQREERADAEEDLQGMHASRGVPVVAEGAEDSEAEDAGEEAARAEAAEFLDTYLTFLLQDESTPARGALQSLRIRMEDAGVIPETMSSSEPGDESYSASSRHATRVPVTISSEDRQPDSMMQDAEGLGAGNGNTFQGGAVVDVWGARIAPSEDDGERAWQGDSNQQPSGAFSTEKPGLFMHLGAPQDVFSARDEQQRLRMTGHGAGASEDGIFGNVREAGDGAETLMLRGRDWAKEDPEGVDASRESCSAWSRIVRKPLKRGKHVVLDLCVASRDQRSGQLERHIVAHSDRRKAWLGPAAYRLARHAKWGDLWPSIYHKNPRVRGWQ